MHHKSFDIVETKADAESGTFEALVSVFGNVDRGGDRVMPGAFAKTLEAWRASGDPIPVILSHNWSDPMHHIGVADPNDVIETDKGLLVRGRLDVEDNPVAKQVHRLMQRRSLKEFSFGYDVPKGGMTRTKDGVNELNEINPLVEVGPTLKGMNPATELVEVKSALEEMAPDPPPDEDTLRKQAAALERESVEERLPEVVDAEVVTEPAPGETVEELQAAVASMEREIANLKAKPEKTEAELRKEVARLERELVEAELPKTDAAPPDKPDPVVALAKQVETLTEKVRLLAERIPPQAQEDPAETKKAEETDKEATTPRSVDPLRRQADMAVLEIASGGISERKPPKAEPVQPKEEPPSQRELRRWHEEVILSQLTGAE